jgi:sulfoxide reductase heme-binding subunit YedZ
MDEAFWALGRATGVVALVLFTLSVLLGILTRSGRPLFTLPRFSITLIHRNVSVLATVFILIHLLSLLADSYAQLRVVDLVFPFLGAYRPFWLGLGTVAVDLLVAVVVTSLLRRHVGQRVFRLVHWSTYLMWPIALAHSLGTGTDAAEPWFLALAAACTLAVVGAVGWRVTAGCVEYRSVRRAEDAAAERPEPPALGTRGGPLTPAGPTVRPAVLTDPHRSPHHLSPAAGRRP